MAGDVTLVFTDGVRSAVRTCLALAAAPAKAPVRNCLALAALPAEAPVQPRFTGLGNIGGFLPATVATLAGGGELEPGRYRVVFGHRSFFGCTAHPVSQDVWGFADPPYAAEVDAAQAAQTDWRAGLVAPH